MFPDFKAAGLFVRYLKALVTECRAMDWKQLFAFAALLLVILLYPALAWMMWLSIPEIGKQVIIFAFVSLASIAVLAWIAKCVRAK